MTIKLIGAVLIVAGCGGCGFSMAAFHRREEAALRQLIRALEWMEWELSCRLTPLPELCEGAAGCISGPVQLFLKQLAQSLRAQAFPDAAACAKVLLQEQSCLTCSVSGLLSDLSGTLGRFDLPGQLQGLQSVKGQAQTLLRALSDHRDSRLRSYQTLGLCAGAALAILFL